MRIEDVYPSKYVRGEDLAGKPVTLTIVRVVLEAMCPGQGAPATQKPVIYFEKAKKAVIMSRALWIQIAAITGDDDTNTWKGKKIQLYPEKMTVAGQPRIAIRARQALEIPTAMIEEEKKS